MPAQLVALDGNASILLDKPILLLGRHPECDIQIDSRKISRRHCCIAQVSDYLVVRDLGSTNGIRINGVRVVEGRLRADDELTIGNNRYKVTWGVVPAPAAPPASSPQPLSPVVREARDEKAPLAGAEDELLESCDEPVPLDEPSAAFPLHPSSPPPPAVKEEAFVLPEELELMPHSDLFSENDSPSSHSGTHPPAA